MVKFEKSLAQPSEVLATCLKIPKFHFLAPDHLFIRGGML